MINLHSEEFTPLGNVVSEGVWNQLGRPELDRLSLLFREAIQNSWDARLGERIRFAVEGFGLSASQAGAFREFFASAPPKEAYRSPGAVSEDIEDIRGWLADGTPRLLVISDRGTSGLDGPVRADQQVEPNETRNFVDFLRNVGQPPSSEGGGGTFGYGKAAFYLASRCRTILVYTKCRHRGRPETRLVAASLTHNFQTRGRRFTGRHWWGTRDKDEVVVPLINEEADELAGSLGMPQFGDNEFGTSIAIASPAFDDEELGRIDRIALRNLWPKLKARKGGPPPVELTIRISGHSVPIPDADSVPPYDAYWRAYLALHDETTAGTTTYNRVTTGRFAFEKSVLFSLEVSNDLPEHEQRAHHIALIRAPEIVVRYLDASRSMGAEHLGFVGVFKAAKDVDYAFAQSEPPTHDDWEPASVSDKKAKGIVSKAIRTLRKEARFFARLGRAQTTSATGQPLAQLAHEFAQITPGLTPNSAVNSGNPTRKKREKSTRARAAIEEQQTFEVLDGVPHVTFTIDVTHAKGARETLLLAEAFPLVSGGTRETDPPVGTSELGAGTWVSPRGTTTHENPVRVGPKQQGTWQYRVPLQESVAVALEVSARKASEK